MKRSDDTRATLIAPNHKFALLAVDAEARLDGHWLEIAPDLIALHDAPFVLPKYWREWLGTLKAQRLEKCRLFILVAAPANDDAALLDHENRWLEHRADLFYRALALTSVGFKVRYGMIMVDARGDGDADVRQGVSASTDRAHAWTAGIFSHHAAAAEASGASRARAAGPRRTYRIPTSLARTARLRHRNAHARSLDAPTPVGARR